MVSRRMALLFGAAVSLLMSGTGLYARAENVSQLQQQEQSARALLAQDQANYQAAQSSVGQAMQKLGQLSGQLTEAKAAAGIDGKKVASSKAQLAKTQAMLQVTTEQVTSTSRRLSATEALYKSSVHKFHRTESASNFGAAAKFCATGVYSPIGSLEFGPARRV